MPYRSSLACLLLLAAAMVVTGAPAAQEGVFEFASTSTAKVLIIGKTANIKIFPNKTSSSYLTLKFNRIEELDDDGKAVYGHAITSLAGLTPTYSTGVRTSGDTDYTYVKMVYDGAALKMGECPSEDKLEELGLGAPGPAGARAPAPAKAAQASKQAAVVAEREQQPYADGQPIKTLGDSKLAATIAQLTAVTIDPPPRPEAMMTRRLAEAVVLAPQQAPASVLPSKLVSYTRANGAQLAPMQSIVAPTVGADGLTKDGKDPFAPLVTVAPGRTAGQVSVVTGPVARGTVAPAVTTGGAPSITVTFFFGMTANKTFAYGKGNSINVPADGVKFNIEAANWPFCSPLNSLKFDIAVATNMQEAAQAQITADPTAEVANPSAMITDMYAAPTRHLMQPGDISGSFLDAESAIALALASAGKQAKLPTKTVKLLVSTTKAVSIDCPTVAYPAVGSAINSSVAIGLISTSVISSDATASKIANATLAAVSSANSLGGSRLSITFPYFETLYYDPVVSFGSIEGMSVNDIAPQSNCTGVVCGRAPERRTNAAVGLGSAAKAAALAAAAALIALLW